GFVLHPGRLLPPSRGADHIEAAVAVDVADAEAVREAERPGGRLARLARLADGMRFPRLRRVLAGRQPGHLALLVVALALGLDSHDQDTRLIAEQVDVLRRLVAGVVVQDVFLPVPRLVLGVLVPVTDPAGEANDDQVRPAVAVDVVGPAAEAFAVA